MIIRAIAYFIFLVIFCEGIAITAVAWSFYESSRLSLNVIKYTSDNKARDMLFSLAKAAEGKMTSEGLVEISTDFSRIKKQSEKDVDKFGVREIFILSDSGKVLAHSNKEEISIPFKTRPVLEKYNKPFFMRALRMRKGQFPIPQDYGETYHGDGSRFSEILIRLFPDLKIQTVTVSSPVYHVKKLETVASIHMIYDRSNFHFFLGKQKELLFWMLINYSSIGLGSSILLGLIFLVFSILTKKQGMFEGKKVFHNEAIPPVVKKMQIQEKEKIKPELEKTPLKESKIERMNSPVSLPKSDKTPVVLDAIYLD